MERQGHASTYRLSLPITTGRADDVFTFLPPAGQGGSCRCGQEFCTLTRLDLDEQGVVHGLASGAMRFVSVKGYEETGTDRCLPLLPTRTVHVIESEILSE